MATGDDSIQVPGGGHLRGKTVVLGVCGGVAAYKAVELCRRLVDEGAEVVPVLTENAEHFVGCATFDALGSEPAVRSLWDQTSHPVPHIELARRADLVVVAPATARLIGSYTAGIPDDVLTNVLVATRAPVILCPSMHTEMWEHPSTQDNITVLRRRGIQMIGPASGRLAAGDNGVGRLADTHEILSAARTSLSSGLLDGLSVLVTAGGTQEPIDGVRVIGNRSSGKQGHALAEAAATEGAKVVLVTASFLAAPPGVEVVRVRTGAEMGAAVFQRSDTADIIIMAAAVADFRPADHIDQKLHRSDGEHVLRLVPTEDILAELLDRRSENQVIVGFAAEWGRVERGAEKKLARKPVDLLVANDVSQEGAGFDGDDNEVVLLSPGGLSKRLASRSKLDIAREVVASVASIRASRIAP